MNFREIEMAYFEGKSLEEIKGLYIQLIENIADEDKIQVWQHVCGFVNEDMIAYLLSIGWRAAGVTDNYGNTLLHLLNEPIRSRQEYFVEKNKLLACTKLLLDAKVSTFSKNDAGEPALLLSTKYGSFEMLVAYNERNIKIDVADKNGNTILHLLAENFSSVKFNYNHATKNLERLLQDQDLIKFISESSFELKKEQMTQEVHIAKKNLERYLTYASLALEYGLDPYQVNNRNETAIDVAIRYKSKEIGAIFKGVDTENEKIATLQFQAGGMNIYQACQNKDAEALIALIQLGEPLNEIYDKEGDKNNGMTPLAIAMEIHNFEITEILLKNGANASLVDSKSFHPFAYLFTAQSGVNTNSDQFKEKIFSKILQAYLSNNFDANSPIDDQSNTLLLASAKYADRLTLYNNDSISNVLIDELIFSNANVDINKTNQNGVSALMYLCLADLRRGEKSIISLLEQGASTELIDKNGKTALIYAAQNSDKATAKNYAELMSEFGNILIETKDNNGKTALDYAQENNNELLANWLILKM